MKKSLILLVGKSGSGKTTIAEQLEKNYGLKMLESYTTRKPRYDGERGHIFVTQEDFEKMPNKVAHTFFDEHDYWATQEQCDESDVYVIDPDGIKTFRKIYNSPRPYKIVYLKISPIVRFWRMTKRGDGMIKAAKRIMHDYKKFGKFENEFGVNVIGRDPVWCIAKKIFEMRSL